MRNEWNKVLAWNNKEYEGDIRLTEKEAVSYELSDASVFELLTK